MALKRTDEANDPDVIDRWDGGVGWIAHPEESMERASHALAADGEVWLVDPVDGSGIDDVIAEYGDVAGVVVAFDRHRRDAATIADRHGVSVHVPAQLEGIADDLADDGADVRWFDGELARTGYRTIPVVNNPLWREVALYNGDDGTLLIPETVGTAEYFLAGDERLGVHPMVRWRPPAVFDDLSPERILVGHGSGVFDNAAAALDDAIDGARRGLPRLYAKTLRSMAPL